jgi:hypothetical protein
VTARDIVPEDVGGAATVVLLGEPVAWARTRINAAQRLAAQEAMKTGSCSHVAAGRFRSRIPDLSELAQAKTGGSAANSARLGDPTCRTS